MASTDLDAWERHLDGAMELLRWISPDELSSRFASLMIQQITSLIVSSVRKLARPDTPSLMEVSLFLVWSEMPLFRDMYTYWPEVLRPWKGQTRHHGSWNC